VTEWLQDGFGLVIGINGEIQLGNACNYNAAQISATHTSLLSLLCLYGLSPGNGSQRRRSLSFHVSRLRSSLAGASLTSQLGIVCSQPSNKGYSSRLYGSRTAFPNRRLKTVLLCRWPPRQASGPPSSDSDCLGLPSSEQSHSQSYFTTGSIPPNKWYWYQAPWGSRPEIYFATEPLRL
jgi:hypothetical protein